jgi:hypothetical protein
VFYIPYFKYISFPEKFIHILRSRAKNGCVAAAISYHHTIKESAAFFSSFNPGKVENSKTGLENSNRVNFKHLRSCLTLIGYKSHPKSLETFLSMLWKHTHKTVIQRLCALVAKSPR